MVVTLAIYNYTSFYIDKVIGVLLDNDLHHDLHDDLNDDVHDDLVDDIVELVDDLGNFVLLQ